MLELMFCAFFTILPDFLIKRFVFKKRWGREITFFTIWYELRWGITACAILTVSLITLIFYYHPSTTNVTAMFRTVTILPESSGRVEKVFVENYQLVKKGEPLFSLDSSSQGAAVETARSSLEEIEAEFSLVKADLEEAEGAVSSTESRLTQAKDDLRRTLEVAEGGDLISERDIELSKNKVVMIEGELVSEIARRDEVLANLNTLLPAQQETARDALDQAIVEVEKTVVYAEVSGRVTQLVLQPGDIVNPMLRPAGLLLPDTTEVSGTQAVQAGFHQLAASIVKPGTLAEITCLSKPFTIIPMVVTSVQASIAAGQLRPTDQMLDLQDRARAGTMTVRLEPLYENGLDGVLPGSKCIANAYTNNHELIASGQLETADFIYYHMVDTVGIVHALLLRIQSLMLPVKTLVFSGH
ncbi:MAG: HlyD family secretion protein [Desulfocapsaceae bacterium]